MFVWYESGSFYEVYDEFYGPKATDLAAPSSILIFFFFLMVIYTKTRTCTSRSKKRRTSTSSRRSKKRRRRRRLWVRGWLKNGPTTTSFWQLRS
jgi:ABC-type Fe3+ transport system permease subunit